MVRNNYVFIFLEYDVHIPNNVKDFFSDALLEKSISQAKNIEI